MVYNSLILLYNDMYALIVLISCYTIHAHLDASSYLVDVLLNLVNNIYYLWTNYLHDKNPENINRASTICTASLHTWRMKKSKRAYCTHLLIGKVFSCRWLHCFNFLLLIYYYYLGWVGVGDIYLHFAF